MKASSKKKRVTTPKRELSNRLLKLKAKRKEILIQAKELPILNTRIKLLEKMLKTK